MRALQLVTLLAVLASSDAAAFVLDDCAYAPAEGFHLGNGGDALVRRDPPVIGAVESAELLDFYESRLPPRRFTVDLGPPSLSVYAKVELALARIERLDRARAASYRAWLGEFEAEACFMRGVTLVDIPDSQHVSLPRGPGWAIEQIAVQREPQFPEDRRYTINADLWEHLDNDNRAGLILHELIYREAATLGAETSVGVRYMTAAIAGKEIDAWDPRTYVDRLRRAGMPRMSWSGVALDLTHPITFHANGTVNQSHAVYDSLAETPWGELQLRCDVEFDVDGQLRGFTLGAPARDLWIEIGPYPIAFTSRGPYGDACDALPPAPHPWAPHQHDVYLEHPDDPARGDAYVHITNLLPVDEPGLRLTLTGFIHLERGRLRRGQNEPGYLSRPTTIDLDEVTCPVARGLVHFPRPDEPRMWLPLDPCDLSSGRGGPLKIKGMAGVSARGERHTLHNADIDTAAIVPLNARNAVMPSNHISYHAYPVVQSTVLGERRVLLQRDGTALTCEVGAYLVFDADGWLHPEFGTSGCR